MKKLIILGIILWFGCGFLAAGISKAALYRGPAAYWDRQGFPKRAEGQRRFAVKSGIFNFLTGPLGLLIAYTTYDSGYYGFLMPIKKVKIVAYYPFPSHISKE